jgi:hypothetical protein
MDVERTEWITKFVSYMREQPGQQLALLVLRQPLQFLRRKGLSYCLGKDSFHELDGNTICRWGKDGDGIARRIRDVVQNLHGAGGPHVALPTGTHQYLFTVDGKWVLDPKAMLSHPNSHGGTNSVILV